MRRQMPCRCVNVSFCLAKMQVHLFVENFGLEGRISMPWVVQVVFSVFLDLFRSFLLFSRAAIRVVVCGFAERLFLTVFSGNV